jgi:hypothetical protein
MQAQAIGDRRLTSSGCGVTIAVTPKPPGLERLLTCL